MLIRSQITQLDAYQAYNPENDWDGDEGHSGGEVGDADNGTNSNVAPCRVAPSVLTFRSNDHFILGSYQGTCAIQKVLENHPDDDTFTSFCLRLSVTIKKLNPTEAITVDESCMVCNF